MFRWFKWLGLAVVVGGVVLGISVKTYIASLNREEVKIAVLGSTHEIVFAEAGEIRIYHYDWPENIIVKLTYNGQTSSFSVGPNTYIDTGVVVATNSAVTEQVIDSIGPSYGWISPVDEKCGAPGHEVNISDYLNAAASGGKPLVAVQCWADSDTGETEPEPDYNDYLVILSYNPGVGSSPSPERQDICGTTGSTSIDKSSIAPGESATVTSTTGGTEVNKFSFAMYNRDNEYSPGNPKPICAAGSGGVQGDCPAGTHHLILADDDQTTMRTIGSKTFTYEDVFVADMNWGGETVNRIQINGYFQIDDGPVSLPNTRCVAYTKMFTTSSETNQASFVIHKFLDANNNGVREVGEGPTNQAWEFEYQVDGGEKINYMIEPGEEEGEKIMVDKGVKVKVAELGHEGWLNTTGAELTKTLADPKLYTYYFGNYPVGGLGGASPEPGFPPTQPDTGAPTWLTAGAVGAGVILFMVKWLWL